MASHQESRLPQPGRDKRRSFLPAPSKISSLPTKQTNSREGSPSRDPRELREPRELRDPREFREPKEHRELREPRELRYSKELKEPKQRRELREPLEPVEPLEPGIKVGDRISISGVKHGILRYLGDVHIAPGIWCGIELDDPDGKHDGEVEGRRYFFCRKSHGVFAPVDKVELVQAVDVPIKQTEIIPENVLKRRSLPRPASALVKSSLPSVRPVSTGAIADVRKQVVDERREDEEEAVAAPTEKGKGSGIQQKSQIAKISGIPRVGLTSALPSTQLKQQDGSTDIRPKKDIRSVFSNLISDKGDERGADDRYGSSESVKEGSVSSISSDQSVSKLQKPSRLPGASRLPTKFSKLDRPSPTEPKPPPSEEVQQQIQPQALSKTFDVQDVNKTFEVKQEVSESQPDGVTQTGEDEDADLTRQLKSDSRQFLNITFDAENHSQSPQSLPDVVSSASMSPESGSEIDQDSLATKGNTDEASIDALDDEAMWDNTDLLDDLDRETKMAEDRVRPDPDSSPLVASTPLPVAKRRKCTGEDIEPIDFSEAEKGKNTVGIKDLFPKLEEGNTNMNATFQVNEEQADGSFVSEHSDGKPGKKCDLIDTVSSKNYSNSSHMENTFLVEKGITDISMPVAEMEEVCELEKTKVEDILEGMSKSVVMDLEKALDSNDKSMIDSGIMDPVTLNRRSMTESGIMCAVQQENRRSMTDSMYQDLIKQDKKPMIDSGISDGSMTRSQQLDLDDQQRLEADLKAGHTRKERPISLISTTSADTGYVADTDSEAGTLTTTTSPLEWMEKTGGRVESNLSSVLELDDSYRESFSQGHGKVAPGKDLDRDSDNYSDAGVGKGVVSGQESDLDESCLPIPEAELTGLSPLPSDSSLQEHTAKTRSPSTANSSLIEDDRAEADQILTAKGGNPESSAENTLKDLSDASPDGGEMPLEESVISGEVTASQKDTSINDTANESASQDKSVAESSFVTDESTQGEHSGDKSAIDLDKSGTESVKTPAKGKSATPASKKKSADKVIEHKKPNLKVRSSLADYIRAPLPTKPKEEKEDDSKAKKNVVNKKRADNKKSDLGKSPESANEEENDSKRIRPKIEKDPPKIIKRTPPKSKWDNIMSQIDSTKVPKPKPKSEIKSKLEAYLSTPPPVKKEREPKKETKPKSFVMSTPKPDYSKVKSKLSISTPPPPKRDTSPAGNKKSPRYKSPASKMNGNIVLDLSESLDNSVSSVRSSRTDLSVDNMENGSESPHPAKLKTPRGSISRIARTERPSSVTSNLSEGSQGSVKIRNAKNKKSEGPKSETPIKKKFSNVKSSIPPPAPRKPPSSKTPPKKTPETSKKDVSKTSPKRNGNQNRNRSSLRTPSKSSSGLKSNSHQPDLVSTSIRSSSEKELTRLETLCESRTKELNLVKMQLKNSAQAFEAMTCLVKYLTQELDAFSCPVLAEKLKLAEKQLQGAKDQIGDLEHLKSRLEGEISDLTKSSGEYQGEIARLEGEVKSVKQAQEEAIAQLEQQHEEKVREQRQHLERNNKEYKIKAKDRHEQVVSYMKDVHERNVTDLNLDHKRAIDSLRLSHLEDIEKLRTKHDNQMEELHKQHRDKLEDITHRFETIKMTLGEKVETLRGECEDLRTRAKITEDALLRDSDVKLQLALEPFRNLPAEIESLKLVIEMRNEEVHQLRKHNMELEKQLEDLPIAKEKIASLQQKVENLEAIINLKTDHEKQLHEKCMNLMKKYDRESKANKRLSMDYEQLMWKVDQDFGSTESLYRRQMSRSPTRSECSSPDFIRKGLSPIVSETDSPSRRSRKSTSSADDSFDRKLKRRSATFLLEKEKSSPSASPQAKRLSPNSFEVFGSPPQVMSQSAGELTYNVSSGNNSPPDSSSPSVSQSMSQSMTQSMTDSDIFGDFESSGIVMNGQEISVSLPLPAEKEDDSEVFKMEPVNEKVESNV